MYIANLDPVSGQAGESSSAPFSPSALTDSEKADVQGRQ